MENDDELFPIVVGCNSCNNCNTCGSDEWQVVNDVTSLAFPWISGASHRERRVTNVGYESDRGQGSRRSREEKAEKVA